MKKKKWKEKNQRKKERKTETERNVMRAGRKRKQISLENDENKN